MVPRLQRDTRSYGRVLPHLTSPQYIALIVVTQQNTTIRIPKNNVRHTLLDSYTELSLKYAHVYGRGEHYVCLSVCLANKPSLCRLTCNFAL